MKWKQAALDWFDDLSVQGILLTDADLNIRGWNQWLVSHSGRSAAEAMGQNLLEIYPELTPRRLDEYYKNALAGRVSMISQRLHGYLLPMSPKSEFTKFQHMQQSARIAPLIAEGQVIGTITIIEDVTERVERENRLVELLAREKAARAEAEAANRAKDEFLAIVSHELRTPLNAISGWVQVLRNRKYKESSAHALEAIERNAKAQTKLIEDILDASRIIAGKLRLDARPVDLAPVIEAAIDTIRLAAEAKSIQIEALLDSGVGLVFGDPNRLQQVVLNILSNAIKFTPKQGRIEVRLRCIDSQAEVAITDSGQGIEAEFLPRVFDRFRQADSSSARLQGGLGLGLAIVRHLMELHGGTVQAESEGKGHGATFRLTLPVLTADAPELSDDKEAASAAGVAHSLPKRGPIDQPALSNVRVMIVEDEIDSREMLRALLSQCGAEVRDAGTAREALKVLEEWPADVLVSDIGMPEEDGYSLIRMIRAREPERGGRIPAVALTGYAGPEDRLRLLAAGYQAYVTKPIELAELALVVASLARGVGQGSNA